MRKILFILAVLLVLNTAPVFASDYIEDKVPNAKTVGEGRLTYMLWDVYDAVLYAPNGKFEPQKPFALSLTYLRDLSGKKIADRSVEEMRNQGFKDEIRLAAWHTQMTNIFPDVSEGVSLTGLYTDNGESIFYKNGIEVGRIKDKEFGKYFFDIWLNKKTSAPDLRANLLGLR